MATAEEKWKRQQLLVAEKIGEDPAAGRGEIQINFAADESKNRIAHRTSPTSSKSTYELQNEFFEIN
jgi:hypothetical protein